MNAGWAVVGGLALGIGAAWWLAREAPSQAQRQRAEQAAAAAAADARPVLYRWRDAGGALHVTDQPPKGHHYERVEREPRRGIEVHGDRD